MNKVELHMAWEWCCDDCGRQNFCSSISHEMSDDERREQLEEMGLSEDGDVVEWMRGTMALQPEDVVCVHCGSEFETEGDDAEEE